LFEHLYPQEFSSYPTGGGVLPPPLLPHLLVVKVAWQLVEAVLLAASVTVKLTFLVPLVK
jgi:hypothetical protein